MGTYKILIDGELYEGSDNRKIALHLYNTVDSTCLHYFYGKRKELHENGKIMCCAIIKKPE